MKQTNKEYFVTLNPTQVVHGCIVNRRFIIFGPHNNNNIRKQLSMILATILGFLRKNERNVDKPCVLEIALRSPTEFERKSDLIVKIDPEKEFCFTCGFQFYIDDLDRIALPRYDKKIFVCENCHRNWTMEDYDKIINMSDRVY